MNGPAWQPIARLSGDYVLCRVGSGSMTYLVDSNRQVRTWKTRQAARRAAERMNVSELPTHCSQAQLDNWLSGTRISINMRAAITGLLVDGMTWRQAAALGNVTESGLLRSLRRITSIRGLPTV